MEDEWTIRELARRVAVALDGVRAPNGRVTAQPDERMIRWYATIGLVDRPHGFRGRTALYGRRHLLQLAAIKRRQAEGKSLAEIQAELAGATDDTLAGVAGVVAAPVARPRFWVVRPSPAPAKPATAEPATAEPGAAGPAAESAAVEPAAAEPAAEPAAAEPAQLLYAVPLHPAATLVLRAAPDHDDLAALHAAARPLLDALDARGLLTR